MLTDDALITSVLELSDDEVCVDELGFEQFEDILKNLSTGPINCSETTQMQFEGFEADACCCYDQV